MEVYYLFTTKLRGLNVEIEIISADELKKMERYQKRQYLEALGELMVCKDNDKILAGTFGSREEAEDKASEIKASYKKARDEEL